VHLKGNTLVLLLKWRSKGRNFYFYWRNILPWTSIINVTEHYQISLCLMFFTAVCGVSAYVPYRYHFVNENKTWTEAQSYCRQRDSDLVTINNMEEMKKLNATLKKHLNNTPSSSVWISLVRGDTDQWLWSLADANFYRKGDTYRNWASGEPNNVGGVENCVVMKKSDGTWFDDRCSSLYTFVCYDGKNILMCGYVNVSKNKNLKPNPT
uniref:C-type lectin domain-containing protein n=1 Tax=Pygocentrus nattereri TaxID=42514 RepID=A0A3B4EKB3_PYGNA